MWYKLAETKRKTMKTAMQEAIENLKQYGLYAMDAAAEILETQFLAKERQQIEEAFNCGCDTGCCIVDGSIPEFSNDSDYYTKTYNNESE